MGKIDKANDLDVIAAKKELETRIHKVLVKLPGLQQHRLQSDSFWRIAECMKVTENTYDFGRLPVYYRKPFAPRPKKYDCLRAIATFVLVKWWDYSLGKNTTPYPMAYLDQLEKIVELGLDAFTVSGKLDGGFKLVLCRKCEDLSQYPNKQAPDSDDESTENSCDCPLGVAREQAIDEAIEPDEEPETEEKTHMEDVSQKMKDGVNQVIADGLPELGTTKLSETEEGAE